MFRTSIPDIHRLRKTTRLIGIVIICLVLVLALIGLFFNLVIMTRRDVLTAVMIGGAITLISMIPSAKKEVRFVVPFVLLVVLTICAIILLTTGGVVNE